MTTTPHRLSPLERADAAERMVPVAAQLAATVRDRDQAGVSRLLADVDPDDYPALIVDLAAMVNVDKTVEELLSWVDWDWRPWKDLAA